VNLFIYMHFELLLSWTTLVKHWSNMPGWTYFLLCDLLHQHGSYYYQDHRSICNRLIIRKEPVLGTLGVGKVTLTLQATLNEPAGVLLDSSRNLYAADYGNHVIRLINASTGKIYTYAGTGTNSYTGDGRPATKATMCGPNKLMFDLIGNVYIADYDCGLVCMVDTTGFLSSVVGNYTVGYVNVNDTSGNGGLAIYAGLTQPFSMMLLTEHLKAFFVPWSGTPSVRRPRTPCTLFMQDISRKTKCSSELEPKDVVIPKGTFMQRVAKLCRRIVCEEGGVEDQKREM
jgi:hypothetical protein